MEEETKRMKALEDDNYKDGILLVARESGTNELIGTGGCMRILNRFGRNCRLGNLDC